MHFRSILIVTALLGSTAAPADFDLAEQLTACDACHGAGGLSVNPEVPIIAGQSAALIEKAHEQFSDMARPCQKMAPAGDPSLTTMCEVSAGMDRAAIEAVTDHYARLAFVPADQPFDPELAMNGAALHHTYCESCHPGGGREAGFAGRLAGQWKPYLRSAIGQIVTAEIQVPHIMERKLANFSEAELNALLDYWASQSE